MQRDCLDESKSDNEIMSAKKTPDPTIISLEFSKYRESDFVEAVANRKSLVKAPKTPLENETLRYILRYPTVYVVAANDRNRYSQRLEHTVYIGETNSIVNRTAQHYREDPESRDDWDALVKQATDDSANVLQYVIGHPHFNKSLTLDVENKLMQYMGSVDSVKRLNNRRTNAQGEYYTAEEFDDIFHQIWLELHHQDSDLFPAEQIILDSALFKASPFHRLSAEQLEAESIILEEVEKLLKGKEDTGEGEDSRPPTLLFVKGAAGTGKTVLLSHLFYQLQTEFGSKEDSDSETDQTETIPEFASYVLVNHHEQVHVYNQIATKLGLQKKANQVVKLPTQFINVYSEKGTNGRAILNEIKGRADVVLIDEAHLLLTQGNQGYSGNNQLADILKRARLVIAVFDPAQILQTAQQWDTEDLSILEDASADDGTGSITYQNVSFRGEEVRVGSLQLEQQFRMEASDEVIKWIDDFAAGRGIGKIPIDGGKAKPDYDPTHKDESPWEREPFEIKVFESPVELYKAITEKAKESRDTDQVKGKGLSRVLATYDWPYSAASKPEDQPNNFWNVQIYRDENGVWRKGMPPDERVVGDDYFCMPWNYQLEDPAAGSAHKVNNEAAWAEKDFTLNEVGSTFTIQGFDLNYAGVIIGPSVKYRDGEIVFDPAASSNKLATNNRGGVKDVEKQQERLRNELNVLLKRGVHGLYLFAVDEELQDKLAVSD